ncbi:MAG: c-type cytochrome [Tannerellaceae bacterium]|nr:c-type cytochrome [Tannerellaceae bacterium]
MKEIKYSILFLIGICMMGCGENKSDIFAPDRLFPASSGLLVANRAGNELVALASDLQTIHKRTGFASPVNDLAVAPNGTLWVVTDGYKGQLYEVEPDGMNIISQTPVGNTPSAVHYNPHTGTLWVTQRFTNRLLEINPATRTEVASVEVGREPVDVISFASGNRLLVANNMPEMSSLAYPVAARLSIVDAKKHEVVKRILLPNGSTDVKAIAVDADQSYAYVTHLLARYQLPTNQVDRGWMSTNAFSIIDLNKEELVTTVLLDTPQKGSANPWGITVSEDNRYIVAAASGTHELVSIDRTALHDRIRKASEGDRVTPSTRKWEDIPNDAGFLYGISGYIPTDGKGPRSVITSGNTIYAANYFTGEIIQVDPVNGNTTHSNLEMAPLVSTKVGEGNMYFHDATLGFQGWQSCASCHPNDARIDGLNWDLLNDGIGNPKNTKTLVYSHETPPAMVTGIRKNAETAVRSGLRHILFAEANEEVSSAMDAYLKSLQAEPSPYLVDGKLSEAAQRGKVSFDKHCASCHSGAYYTNGKLYDIPWSVGTEKGVKMDVSTLNEAWRTAPYLYDGRSYTMREMLDVHGPGVAMSDAELNDLAEYVLSL